MALFHYKCRNPQGSLVSGSREAESQESLASALQAENLIPVEISKAKAGGFSRSIEFNLPSLRAKKVSKDELQVFCRQMYTLLKAGIPVLMAVGRLSETTRDAVLSDALNTIIVRLKEGQPLYLALKEFKHIFSSFFVNLVRVGEETGNLDRVFLFIAEYLELEIETKKKVKTALRYPILVICATLVALVVINIFVVPTFAKMFLDANIDLPLATRILIATSNFLLNYWYVLLAGCIILFFATRYYLSTSDGALKWARYQLKIPVIGWLIHRILLSRFTRLYALVLKAGVTALEGIQMVGRSTGNAYLESEINNITDLIARGNTISTAVGQTKLFSPLVIQMITLGEEAGQIESMLDDVADFYEREINYDLARLSDAIEPILLIIMAAKLLVLALGVFMPMWQMASVMGAG
jgi:MSHA biogenesis protein MshG